MLKVEAKEKPIVLAMVEGKIYAIDQICTHQGGQLDEDELKGYDLKYPWRYAVFDVRNGCLNVRKLPCYLLHKQYLQ